MVKKTDYHTKVTEIENKLHNHNHDKYITTPEVVVKKTSRFGEKIFFDALLSGFNMRVSANTRQVLLAKDELDKLKTFDSSYFIVKSHFEEDGTQNYLVFQYINRYFKLIANTNYISSWESKGLSTESIKPPTTFTGSCLKQSVISYTPRTAVNIYIVYELGASSSHNNDLTLKNCLFGAVTLTKNVYIDKYGYSGYGIGFDRRSSFSFPGGGFGQNVLTFGADMSSSDHIDNKKKNILVYGKGPTQGLEHTQTAEKIHSINFTVKKKIA